MQSADDGSLAAKNNVTPFSGSGWIDKVQEQLARLLTNPEFTASDRGRRMLRYLVEETLAGKGAHLKQYSIAIDVLGRSDDFDPRADPVVRAEASKLRKALQHYYAVVAGDPIRFVIPKGGYIVQFEKNEEERPKYDEQTRERESDMPDSRPRIAVLPLFCAGNSTDNALLATGLTSELISALSISATKVFTLILLFLKTDKLEKLYQ